MPANALCILEGYAFAASNQREALGELGGVVKCALADVGVPFVVIQPAALKKFATGKGNASKELMLVEAVKRLGYGGSDHNQADALWLRQAALCWYGLLDAVPMPAANREALNKVEWPGDRTTL